MNSDELSMIPTLRAGGYALITFQANILDACEFAANTRLCHRWKHHHNYDFHVRSRGTGALDSARQQVRAVVGRNDDACAWHFVKCTADWSSLQLVTQSEAELMRDERRLDSLRYLSSVFKIFRYYSPSVVFFTEMTGTD